MNIPTKNATPILVHSDGPGTLSGAHIMAVEINTTGSGGGNAVMGFILGAVLLAVAVVGFLMWDNYKSGGAPKAIVVTGQSK
jgi:hypothetical protein